ncbi:hypothetical protein [Micromonospora zamorensis]|uniref:hypothetical protein n=1 Tax=Micromonospora zamorensis TaxID=709883 RepID=UPI003793A8EC
MKRGTAPFARWLPLALVISLAGCSGKNGDAVPEERITPPSAASSPARPPASDPNAGPNGPSAGPDGTSVPSAGRPTPLPRYPSPKPRITPLPKEPTDNRRTDVIAGRITRGGGGPCYGLTTLDGIEYALHGTGVGDLREGSLVTLRVAPPTSKVDCGPGIARSIVPS